MIRSVYSRSFRNTLLPSRSIRIPSTPVTGTPLVLPSYSFCSTSSPVSFYRFRSFSTSTPPYPALANTVTPPEQLKGSARTEALRSIPLWTTSPNPSFSSTSSPTRDTISRSFEFVDFTTAWSFMTRIALIAEKYNHHPEWSNVYNRVSITLTTHDANNSVSLKDIELATIIDRIAVQYEHRPSVTK